MSHPMINVINLEYIYPDQTRALNDISFRITREETVGIVGANGAGKSTLLSHFTGILLPTKGSIYINGHPVTKQTLTHARHSVGMVFQNPDDQLFMPTVYDDVAFGPLNAGFPPEEVHNRVMSALTRVGSAHLAQRPPYRLSAGQKRAVAIASVLSMGPDILVMDEPTAGLDPQARRQLINLLHSFANTKIIASHDLDLVLDLCARTIILSEGKVLADGPTRTIFNDKDLLSRGLLEPPLRLQNCPICGMEKTRQF